MINKTLKAATIAGLIFSSGCDRIEDYRENFQRNKDLVVEEIKKTSPFSQTPISAPLKDSRKERQWYQDSAFVPINSNDIAYVKNNNLYVAKEGNRKQSEMVAKKINIKEKYIFSLDVNNKGASDLYWIDRSYNLKKLRNDNGNFVNEGTIFSLKDKFRYLPKNLELGNINSDGFVDIVYEDEIKILNKRRNVIKVMEGSEYGLKNEKSIYYLDTKILDGLIARDVDNDGDSDLIFKLSQDDKNLFGLENNTKKGKNPTIFRDGFRDKVNDDSSFMLFLIYWYFFMPGSPGNIMNY